VHQFLRPLLSARLVLLISLVVCAQVVHAGAVRVTPKKANVTKRQSKRSAKAPVRKHRVKTVTTASNLGDDEEPVILDILIKRTRIVSP
jgi:hypothetical protein